MPSDGSAVYCEVALPIMEGTLVCGSRPSQVLLEWSGQVPYLRLVFHGVEDMVDDHPEWNKVRLCFTSLTKFSNTPSSLMDGSQIMA